MTENYKRRFKNVCVNLCLYLYRKKIGTCKVKKKKTTLKCCFKPTITCLANLKQKKISS